VMEYYSGGTLLRALGSDSKVLGWRERITLALQVRGQAGSAGGQHVGGRQALAGASSGDSVLA
jgi:hypothetical protein